MKFLLLFLLLLPATFLQAQWSPDPTVNTPICTAPQNQNINAFLSNCIVSDGYGGAIMVWSDERNMIYNYDIYAQKIDWNGGIQWLTNGVPIYNLNAAQSAPQCISDGKAGAIITWTDYRNGAYGIYAQRIDSNGVVQWAGNGITVCTPCWLPEPKITSDGAGGAIITWTDYRNGNFDVYAQKIDSFGSIQWIVNGVPVCLAIWDQEWQQISSDGNGGAYITWNDRRGSDYNDVYAQKINSDGSPQWTLDGIPIDTISINDGSNFPRIMTTENGNAIITWSAYHSEISFSKNIFVQMIDANGIVKWQLNGLPVCSNPESQSDPTITTDGSGGVIISWSDRRNGANYDVYAQRINNLGMIKWTVNGLPIASLIKEQFNEQIISDNNNGAIITWSDRRNSGAGVIYDVYAQRVDSSGNILWNLNGNPICTNTADQWIGGMATDGYGGAIIPWSDFRNGSTNMDIYASQIGADGVLGHSIPVELVSFNSNISEDKVNLRWATATETNNSGFNIERSNGSEFKVLGFVAGHGTTTEIQNYTFTDDNVYTGKYSYRLKQIDLDGTFEYSKTIEVEVTTPLEFSLAQNFPNPFNPSTSIKYAIGNKQFVQIKIYDVLGKEIETLVNEEKPAGSYEVNFNASQLSSGIYFYKLQAGDFVKTRKMILLK